MNEELNNHIDSLLDIKDNINLSKITVLTGTNGSGKSLIAKQLSFRVDSELNGRIKSVSMNSRTQSNPEWGALANAMSDTEWIATSQNTISLIRGLIKATKEENTQYVVLDEFEIGCSEETILALVYLINNLNLNVGMLIITHSRLAVKELRFDNFINIDGLSKEGWLNRKIIPTNIKLLEENNLFSVIRDRMKKE